MIVINLAVIVIGLFLLTRKSFWADRVLIEKIILIVSWIVIFAVNIIDIFNL